MTVYLQITSGRGPEECGWVVARLHRLLQEDASASALTWEEIDVVAGVPGTLRSALVSITGKDAVVFSQRWVGSILWIGQSPFRPTHKRKNWFVGVQWVELGRVKDWRDDEISIEVMRASGPGGQHVNKTSSAVRATHLPTGLNAISQSERSQSQNRRLALLRLRIKWLQKKESAGLANQQERWSQHNQLERGNPIRVFEGPKFRETKK